MNFTKASDIAKHPEGIVWLEKAEGGQVTLEAIGDALEEFGRLFKAGIASSAEILTLSRAYPNDMKFAKAAMSLTDEEPMVIGGPASIELIDREGHLITTNALKKAFHKFMSNFRTRNAMVLHSDVQVGWALPAYITKGGQIFKSGVDEKGLFFICEVRGDTKIAKKVEEQINEGRLKSYSIAGSATKIQNMQKGLMPYMQVDEMELAEVTVCEKGVNQGANFELLKAEVPQTGKVDKDQCGYRDASPAEEMMGENCGHCKYFNQHDKTCDLVTGDIQPGDWCSLFAPCEPEHKKVVIVMAKPNKVNFKKSFDTWMEKTETNKDPLKAKESFATLQNVAGREEVHEAYLQEIGFPAKKDVEDAEAMRYTPVIETEVDDDGKPIRVRPPWVVNEAGQELGDKHDEDSPNYSSSAQAKNRSRAGAVAKMASLFKDMQSFPGKDRKTTVQQKPASGVRGKNMAEHSQRKEDRQEDLVRRLLNRQIQGADDVKEHVESTVVKPGQLRPEEESIGEGITFKPSGKAPYSSLTIGEDEPEPRERARQLPTRGEQKEKREPFHPGRTHNTGPVKTRKHSDRPVSVRVAGSLEKGALTDKLKGMFGRKPAQSESTGKNPSSDYSSMVGKVPPIGSKTMNPGSNIGRREPGESIADHAKRTGIDTAAGYMRAIGQSAKVDPSHMDATANKKASQDMDKAEGVDKRTGIARDLGRDTTGRGRHGPVRTVRPARKVTQSSPKAKPRPEGGAQGAAQAAIERLKAGRVEREALQKPASSTPKTMPKQQRRGFNMSLEDTLIKMMKSGSTEIDKSSSDDWDAQMVANRARYGNNPSNVKHMAGKQPGSSGWQEAVATAGGTTGIGGVRQGAGERQRTNDMVRERKRMPPMQRGTGAAAPNPQVTASLEKGIGDAVRGARNRLGAAIGGKKAPTAEETASRKVARNVQQGRGDAEVTPGVDASMKNQPHMARSNWAQGPTSSDILGPQSAQYSTAQQQQATRGAPIAGGSNKGSLRERVGGFIGASVEKDGERGMADEYPFVNKPSEGEAMGGRRRTPRTSDGQGKPFDPHRKDKQPGRRKDIKGDMEKETQVLKALIKLMQG